MSKTDSMPLKFHKRLRYARPLILGMLLSTLSVFQVTAMAKDVIRCEGKGADPITITMDARKSANTSLHCIAASFIYDLTPCAPSNGFGLSAPTGSAPLGPIVYRWQDYIDHMGGVASNVTKETQLVFAGGFNFPGSGYLEKWRFVVDRISGEAKLFQTEENKTTTKNYSCNRAKTKF